MPFQNCLNGAFPHAEHLSTTVREKFLHIERECLSSMLCYDERYAQRSFASELLILREANQGVSQRIGH